MCRNRSHPTMDGAKSDRRATTNPKWKLTETDRGTKVLFGVLAKRDLKFKFAYELAKLSSTEVCSIRV